MLDFENGYGKVKKAAIEIGLVVGTEGEDAIAEKVYHFIKDAGAQKALVKTPKTKD